MSPAQHGMGRWGSSHRDPSAAQEAAAPNLNCSSLDVCFLWFASTPACAQGLSRLEDGRTEVRAAVPGRAAPVEMGIVPHSHPTVPVLQEGAQCRDGSGDTALPAAQGWSWDCSSWRGSLWGRGSVGSLQEPHYRSTLGAARGRQQRATTPRADLPQSISLTPPHPHPSSQKPAARCQAGPLPFIAPGHAPRASHLPAAAINPVYGATCVCSAQTAAVIAAGEARGPP